MDLSEIFGNRKRIDFYADDKANHYSDQSQKTFLVIAGLGILLPAVLGTCECLGLLPMSYTCVPLVSYGGTAAMMTWLIAGTLASLGWAESAS